MSRYPARGVKGAFIAEGTAAIFFVLPLLMLIIYVAFEVSKAWLIKQSMAAACRESTRMLAEEYAKEGSYNQISGAVPDIVTDRAAQNTLFFNNIRIKNIVNSSAQFTGDPQVAGSTNPTWVIPSFNCAAPNGSATLQLPTATPTVTVTCTYAGGTNGLPPFPDWDPGIWFGGKFSLANTFKLRSEATYRLENQ